MLKRGTLPILALGTLLAITALWWSLALWPLPADAPGWLIRTRAICFGSAPGGLPDAAGWVALILQPTLMIAALLLVWAESLALGLRRMMASRAGRLAGAATAMAVLVGLGAAADRVARAPGSVAANGDAMAVAAYPRLDRSAPALGLTDQHGVRLELDRFRGRPVLVTFAYGHCQTVCPLLVHDALEARALASGVDQAVVIVTLDPWRDTPERLPYLAEVWKLGAGAFVLSGDPAAVNEVLDRWDVPRARDARTGQITHPRLAYIVDRGGRIAYAVNGGPETVATLLEGL